MLKKENRRVYYVFSPFLRIFHWTMVISCVVLFATGLYIAHPFSIMSFEPATSEWYMNMIRNIHLIAAFVFCSSLILRVYGFIVNSGDRLLPKVWEGKFYSGLIEVAMHYSFLRYEHKPYLRNPLARLAYAGLYVMMAVEIITGLAIYFMDANSWFGGILGTVNMLTGDIYTTRIIHHYVAWLIIFFAIGHIYMVLRTDYMDEEGEVSSMVSGIKIYRHRPADVDDIKEEAHTAEYWAKEKQKKS